LIEGKGMLFILQVGPESRYNFTGAFSTEINFGSYVDPPRYGVSVDVLQLSRVPVLVSTGITSYELVFALIFLLFLNKFLLFWGSFSIQ
jgi:hypothetical protein